MTTAQLEETLRRSAPDALVAYVTGGWPSPDRFVDLLQQVAREADVVEIGVPFTDPMADGLTLQRASQQALAAGATLVDLLDRLQGRSLGAPLVVMSYLNPLLALGHELGARLAAAGISGLVVPDLPLEEADLLEERIGGADLAHIQLVAPTTPPARARQLAAASRGFVYAVTALGVTGGQAAIDLDLQRRLAALREAADVPVLAGFGIRTAAQRLALRDHVDGVIVGSALMNHLTQGGDPATLLRGLRSPLRSAS